VGRLAGRHVDPGGPWLLMFMENDRFRLGGSGGIGAPVGQMIPGTWMRIVVRLKLAPNGDGAVEVWLNGVKTVSMLNRIVLPKTGTMIRWSSGIYCNSWRTETPVGPRQISVFHAHARIASSYALAEPANW
jgi:Polysaccharide lyase